MKPKTIESTPYEDKQSFDRYEKPSPVTEHHKRYHNMLKDKQKKIVVCDGYAGTGKTIAAMYYACQMVLNKEAKGIVLVKNMEDLEGFLKGSLEEKMMPKAIQLLKYAECFLQQDYSSLLDDKKIVLQPMSYIQGMDWTDYVMIVDECQLIDAKRMYSICTRGAVKLIINGDCSPAQCTATKVKEGKDGLSFLIKTMDKSKMFGVVSMDKEEDIVRADYIKDIIINMTEELEKWYK